MSTKTLVAKKSKSSRSTKAVKPKTRAEAPNLNTQAREFCRGLYPDLFSYAKHIPVAQTTNIVLVNGFATQGFCSYCTSRRSEKIADVKRPKQLDGYMSALVTLMNRRVELAIHRLLNSVSASLPLGEDQVEFAARGLGQPKENLCLVASPRLALKVGDTCAGIRVVTEAECSYDKGGKPTLLFPDNLMLLLVRPGGPDGTLDKIDSSLSILVKEDCVIETKSEDKITDAMIVDDYDVQVTGPVIAFVAKEAAATVEQRAKTACAVAA